MTPALAKRKPEGRRRNEEARAWRFCAPGVTWLVIFVLVPLVCVWGASFLSRGDYGQVQLPWTLDNYRRLAGWTELGFDPLYPRVLLRTLVVAAGVTVLTILTGLPMAFFIARLQRSARTVALMLVVIPFWTNLLIRTYAWQVLLAADGPLARMLAAVGWINPGTALQPGWFAVVVAMVCDFLPFMVLPLYASVERIDWTLAEAAADLGADRWRVFRHAVLPQVTPGIRAGTLLVFLPAMGQFVIPDLLGGGRATLLGNLIQQQFGPSRDWPFGAAVAALALVVLAAMLVLRRRGRGTKGSWEESFG